MHHPNHLRQPLAHSGTVSPLYRFSPLRRSSPTVRVSTLIFSAACQQVLSTTEQQYNHFSVLFSTSTKKYQKLLQKHMKSRRTV